jgi:hypothetical protein
VLGLFFGKSHVCFKHRILTFATSPSDGAMAAVGGGPIDRHPEQSTALAVAIDKFSRFSISKSLISKEFKV